MHIKALNFSDKFYLSLVDLKGNGILLYLLFKGPLTSNI